jgi:FixJ family two-component response regulator
MGSSKNICVAVIDDDDSLCRSVGRLLRTAGIRPVAYSSAEAFLADGKRPSFDCLILDIQLNGMSGIELNCQLASLGSVAPVIFNTAHDEPEVREQALRSGCAAYLRKTGTGEALLAAIIQAVAPEPGRQTK